MLFYFKKMAVFLNSSHNINYAAIFIFFRIMVLFDVILNLFLKYLYFFCNKGYCSLLFCKIIKVILKFCEIENNDLLLLNFKIVCFCSFRFI